MLRYRRWLQMYKYAPCIRRPVPIQLSGPPGRAGYSTCQHVYACCIRVCFHALCAEAWKIKRAQGPIAAECNAKSCRDNSGSPVSTAQRFASSGYTHRARAPSCGSGTDIDGKAAPTTRLPVLVPTTRLPVTMPVTMPQGCRRDVTIWYLVDSIHHIHHSSPQP